MACACKGGGRVEAFIVTDGGGNCLLRHEDGSCYVFTSAAGAAAAARSDGLTGYQVRPK